MNAKRLLVPLVAALALCFSAATVSAQEAESSSSESSSSEPYGMAGCGLGSMLLGSDDGFMQVFAATTNGTFASQTFGISTGTSNCVERGVVTANKEQEAFFEMNFANIKSDMASGEGEYLAAVGSLFGCSETVEADLASFSQQNYSQIVPNQETTPVQALYSYKMAVSMDDTLAGSCAAL